MGILSLRPFRNVFVKPWPGSLSQLRRTECPYMSQCRRKDKPYGAGSCTCINHEAALRIGEACHCGHACADWAAIVIAFAGQNQLCQPVSFHAHFPECYWRASASFSFCRSEE